MSSKSKRKAAPPPPPSLTIGDEVNAHCRKCRQSTLHTVLRKVGWKPTFVKCPVCETEHDFKPPKAPTPSAGSTEKSPAEEWRLQMTATKTTGKPYDRSRRFEVGDFIQHSGFGDGVVVGRPTETICEVAFERGTIRLIMATQPDEVRAPDADGRSR